MFVLLKLVLITLLNKTYAYVIQDTQTIFLPTWDWTDANNISLTLKAFGQLVQLNLYKTDHIVPVFDVWKYNAIDVIEKWSHSQTSNPCFYVHKDRVSFAVINFCQEDGLEGLIFLDNDLLEIKPFRDNFASWSLINNFCIREQLNLSFGKSHRIKKSLPFFNNLNLNYLDNFKWKRRYIRSTSKKLVMELAVFVDEAAYHIFMPILDNSEEHLRNLILAYVNNIQATFHHPSFGTSLDIRLVRLDIMKRQPKDLPVYDDASKLLDSFCQYAAIRNSPDDNDLHHWDIALYLTGINISETRHKEDVVGKSNYDEMCSLNNSCVIVEFGVNTSISGFASFIVATHEIGHVLGMNHDSSSSEGTWDDEMHCLNYKHIMSSIQFSRGVLTWSNCSRHVAKELWKTKTCLLDHTIEKYHDERLDHMRYHNLPGREWTAKAQCELYSLNKNANIITLHDICQILHCEVEHFRKKYFFAGPALEGTQCALRKECRRGECVPVMEPPYIFKYCKKDEWSEWKKDNCQSPCLRKSKGVIIKRRSCKHGRHNTTSCEGPYYAIDLCDDSKVCDNRKTIKEFTNTKCTEFSEHLNKSRILLELEKKPGLQTAYNNMTPWTACTIFCQQKYISSQFYAPYVELLNIYENPYFPDGTWCHYQNDQNYYCRHHYCLPENYSVK